MKTIPILFSTPMVKVILDGSKVQTRRIIKPQPFLNKSYSSLTGNKEWYSIGKSTNINPKDWIKDNAKAQVGDVFWVRETFTLIDDGEIKVYFFKANNDNDSPLDFKPKKWKPSIFMPKKVCRIFLEVTNVRVERLNDISDSDIKKEGIIEYPEMNMSLNYCWRVLWETINGKDSWRENPFVWVYDFKIIKKPENFNV